MRHSIWMNEVEMGEDVNGIDRDGTSSYVL